VLKFVNEIKYGTNFERNLIARKRLLKPLKKLNLENLTLQLFYQGLSKIFDPKSFGLINHFLKMSIPVRINSCEET